MRALVLAGLCLLAVLAVAPAPAAAECPETGLTVGQNTYDFACGRLQCLQDGLPNILVTCL